MWQDSPDDPREEPGLSAPNDAARPDIELSGPGGHPLAVEAIQVALYLVESRDATRHGARSAIERFVDLVGLDRFEWYHDMDGEAQPLDAASLAGLMHDWFSPDGLYGTLPNATIDLRGDGEYVFRYGVQYWGHARGPQYRADEASFVELWMPRSALAGRGGALRDFLGRTAGDLPVSSGYVSPALIGEDSTGKQGLARRDAALDIADPGAVSADLGSRHAGVYWLNWLGPSLTRQAGGLEALRLALPAPITVSGLADGGAIVRLGPAPQLGDRNRRETLPSYETFARFLHERDLLHVPERVAYFESADGMADREAQRAWHRRFVDEP